MIDGLKSSCARTSGLLVWLVVWLSIDSLLAD